MCGIGGIATSDGGAPQPEQLDALAAALRHRGPDGEGRWSRDDVGMVHTRLAIIDLAGGAQPLFDSATGAALVANGEIYNYRELRAALGPECFATASDCEVPLHVYRRDGLHLTRPLRGMYAIALHDPGRRRLILARDPFGIKPLYYTQGSHGLAFASEPQALLAAGLAAPAVEEKARDEVLALQFSTRCPLAGIERLAPGETLVVEGGRVVERTRLPAIPHAAPTEIAAEEALRRLDAVLMESVDLHQRSDVAYGMFLSGGVDSSALLALMARTNPTPVLAFTAGFPGTGVADERAHARTVAAAVGAEHVEVAVTEKDFWNTLPAIAACLDDPVADYAVVPTWIMAREAARQVKVILSGEGGDELFAGYGRYRAAARPWPWRRRMRRKGSLDGLGLLRREPEGWRDGIAAAERAAGPPLSPLQRAQAVDVATWLPDDLLVKLDRCLMAHGVEGRVPFLDPQVAAFAFRLPDRLKIRDGHGKWLLRRWLDQALPAARPFGEKRGFSVPVGEWILRRPELGPILDADPAIAEICRPGAVTALLRRDGRRVGFAAWTLLFYALWHRRHIRGMAPAGDVFDTLTAK